MLHLGAWAALGIGDTFTADGITYKVTSTNPMEVQVGTGDLKATAIANNTAGDFTIPSAVRGTDGNDYTVTSIGADAFFNCSSLTTIAIPRTVKSIGGGAFYGCSGLTAVHITDLAAWCGISFADHGGSGNIFIRNNTPYFVGSNPLCYAHRLYLNGSEIKDMVIPNSVTSIDDLAFLQFTGLTSVTIPNSLKRMGSWAFNYCTNLTAVRISDLASWCGISFSSSRGNPLYYARHLYLNGEEVRELVIPGSVTAIPDFCFPNCSYLTSVTIPTSVKSIGGDAFSGCSSLTSLTIPKNVTSIGKQAFNGCSGLTSIYSNITEPFDIDSNVFSKFTIPLYVPVGTLAKYKAAAGWSAFEDIIQDDPQSPVKTGTVFAADGITYKVYSNSPLEVQVGTGQRAIDKDTAGDIDIPSTVKDSDGNTFTVTVIGESAFESCGKLTFVRIPETVKKIGRSAFFGCNKLTSVTIPRSVTTIGHQAFDYDQESITSITVEEGNTVFDSRGGCNAIIRTADNELILGCRNTVIPNSVTSIGVRAFTVCYGLTEINIPSSITTIGKDAFYCCTGLKSLFIPASVTSIGDNAFSNSSRNMETIKVESGNPAYDSRGDCNALIDSKTNRLILGCKNTVIPSGVTAIGSYAFEHCLELTSINIPSTVTTIYALAFLDCTGLTAITIPASVTTIAKDINNSFRGCSNLASIKVESGNTVYDSRGDCNAIIVTATNEMIRGCRNTVIPNTVTTIGQSAFDGSNGLEEVVIPGSVTTIGPNAFSNCPELAKVTIPSSAISIGAGAFVNCKKLMEMRSNILEPQPVNNLVSANTYYQAKLYVPSGTKEKYASTNGWKEFRTIVEPDKLGDTFVVENVTYKVTSIDKHEVQIGAGSSDMPAVDQGATGSVFIPRTVTSPYGNTYTVKSVATGAFRDCSGLTQVSLPGTVTAIGNRAFQGCEGLKEISIPNSVKTIGTRAFYGCVGLNSIIIPYAVENIEQYAFAGCTGLKEVKCYVKQPFTISSNVFSNYEIPLYVPSGTQSKYEDTDSWSVFADIKAVSAIAVGDIITNDGINYQVTSISPAEVKLGRYDNCSVNTAIFGNVAIPSAVYAPDNSSFIVKTIGNNAFRNNLRKVTGITIPNTVEAIGNYSFAYCGITDLDLPSSLKSLGNQAFGSCPLTSVTIPSSLTSISGHPFSGCSSLTSITVESGNPVYDSREGCNAIINSANNELTVGCKGTVIPNSVVRIGDNAFYYMSLSEIIIPSSVTSIGDLAFYYSYNVKEIFIPRSVGRLGINPFSGCYNANIKVESGNPVYDSRGDCNAIINTKTNELVSGSKATAIPNTVTSIGEKAFNYCHYLDSLVIPSSVVNIAANAFYGCSRMMKVTIPASVKLIGEAAFGYCDNLVSVISLIKKPYDIEDNVFGNNTRNSGTLYVPVNTKSKYQTTDGWKNFQTIIETDFNDQPQGDVNGDNVVDVADIATVISVMAKGGTDAAADVNGDGVVDVADIATIISIMAGKGW